MLRKKILLFLSIYFLIILGLGVIYVKVTSIAENQLSITLNKIRSVEYLNILQSLNFNIVKISDHDINKNLQEDFRKKTLADIKLLLTLQEKNPSFKNVLLNKKLQKLQNFQLTNEESYQLIDYLNQENYIIGDKSHLIYEEDKKVNLLSALYTHYLPEYILSTLVCHSIAESYANMNIFLEQNKLINLSLEELDSIITLLARYEDTQKLSILIKKIKSVLPSVDDVFTKESIKSYLDRGHQVLELSYKLLHENFTLLHKGLKEQKELLEERILYSKIIFFVVVLLFTIILYLYYRSKVSNLFKDQKLYNMHRVLDKYALLSRSDRDGNIIYASSVFETLTGFSVEEITNSTYNIFNNPKMDKKVFKELWETILAKKVFHGDILNKKKSGEDFWVKETIVPELDFDGEILYLTTYMVDITDKKELQLLNKQLEELSSHDTLTGAYNRLKIDTILQHLHKSYQRYKKTFSIILIDIDHFKNINDTYGHLVGDEVLKRFATLIQENIRESDYCGRWGGEEFLIICEYTTKDDSFLLAEKIRTIVEAHIFPKNSKITMSSGISQITAKLTLNELIQEADDALYQAKRNGRNQTVIYKKENKDN